MHSCFFPLRWDEVTICGWLFLKQVVVGGESSCHHVQSGRGLMEQRLHTGQAEKKSLVKRETGRKGQLFMVYVLNRPGVAGLFFKQPHH